MKIQALWERCRIRAWAPRPAGRAQAETRTPKPFQRLSHNESVAVLEEAVQWLIAEAKSTLEMPEGPAKRQRWAELEGRDQSLVRDFQRLLGSRRP